MVCDLTSSSVPVLDSVGAVIHLTVDEIPELGLGFAGRGGAVDLQEVARAEPLTWPRHGGDHWA